MGQEIELVSSVSDWMAWANVALPTAGVLVAFAGTMIALRSVRITRVSAQQSLRAYVLPEKVEVHFFGDHQLRVVLPFRNTGQTPAHNVSLFSSKVGVRVSSERFELDHEDPNDKSGSMTVLGRDQKINFDVEFQSNKEANGMISLGRATVYVWGKLLYRDVFGVQHHTKFRFMHTGSTPEVERMIVCDEGNEAT